MLETFCKRLGEEETMSVKALIAYNIYQAISKNKDFAKAALDVATYMPFQFVHIYMHCS